MADDANTHGEPAPGSEIGSLIAAVFGLVFVLVNSSGLSTPVRIIVAAAAVAAAIVVLALSIRGLRRTNPPSRGSRGPVFGRGYWIIVLLEVVALFAGARMLTVWGLPELGVAWVALVVGTHFFALGRLFGLGRFHVLAVVVTACGLAGFVLAWCDVRPAVAVVSGVVPGFVLLGFALWALWPPRRRRPGSSPVRQVS